MSKITSSTHDRPFVQQLGESLARRLSAMADGCARLRDAGTVMAPEDVAEITERLRGLARDARALEGGGAAPRINMAVAPAFRVLGEAEDALRGARAALREHLEAPDADPDGTISRRLAGIVGQIEQAQAIIAGRGRVQS